KSRQVHWGRARQPLPWSGHIRAAHERPTDRSRDLRVVVGCPRHLRRCATLLDRRSGWLSRLRRRPEPDTGRSAAAESTGWSGPLPTEVFPGPLHRVRVARLGAVPGGLVVLAVLQGVRRVLLLGDALGQVVRVGVALSVPEFRRAPVVAVP